jgi:DnaA family protein
VDGPNAAARHWVELLMRAEGPEAVYLWGPSGSGKTHLLEAAGRAFADGGGQVAYLPLARPERLSPSIFLGLEGLHLVCIDDVDAVGGQREWEDALFHLLNRLRHAGTRWVATGNGPPGRLGLTLPDLASRLAGALTARLSVLTEPDRVEALERRARERGFRLPEQVTRFLLRRYPRDPHSLFALLDDLDRLSLQQGRRVTLPLVRALVGGEAARLSSPATAESRRADPSYPKGA